eukprot:TRINITY_DN4101_c0_g1_i1.p1 TRINITY_DN4101_c0_g1~~TRINITY_DN4101_c0_g1_i1.p1  ORF type:complete len:687 (+),score=176.43 TRINITY_DN4101_c0_g1_i1:279-2339(+)
MSEGGERTPSLERQRRLERAAMFGGEATPEGMLHSSDGSEDADVATPGTSVSRAEPVVVATPTRSGADTVAIDMEPMVGGDSLQHSEGDDALCLSEFSEMDSVPRRVSRRGVLGLWDDVAFVLLSYWWVFLAWLLFAIVLAVLGILVWTEMTWAGWVSIALTVITLTLLVKDEVPPAFIFCWDMAILLVLGIITPAQALVGFSNSGVVTIGLLFIVARAIENTKVLGFVLRYLLRKPKSVWVAQLRLLLPVAIMSAFMNNTPIVAIMIPVISTWALQCNIKASKLLMPLSFAAILGGTCTLIGTSTNLIVVGLAQESYPDLELNFFEIAVIGVPVMIAGIIYMIIASHFELFLPTRQTAAEEVYRNPREYSVGVVVKKGSVVIGKTLEQAGLRNLPSVFLYKIDRCTGEVLSAPGPKTIILEGDVLYFAGIFDRMQDIYRIQGLAPATHDQVNKLVGHTKRRCIVEAVLASRCPIVGLTVKQCRFRTLYNAAVIGVHREGVRVNEKIGDIRLQAGDVLLMEAPRSFLKQHKQNQHFALVAEVSDRGVAGAEDKLKMAFAVLLTLIVIVGSTVGLFPLVGGALFAVCVFLTLGYLTWDEALAAANGNLLLLIAAAFALASALDTTDAARIIAESLVGVLSVMGPIGILTGLYVCVSALSAIIRFAIFGPICFASPLSFHSPLSSGVS